MAMLLSSMSVAVNLLASVQYLVKCRLLRRLLDEVLHKDDEVRFRTCGAEGQVGLQFSPAKQQQLLVVLHWAWLRADDGMTCLLAIQAVTCIGHGVYFYAVMLQQYKLLQHHWAWLKLLLPLAAIQAVTCSGHGYAFKSCRSNTSCDMQ